MSHRRIGLGTVRGGGPWAVLLVLLVAVLVPTACVLWFMTAAMRNERLAVRQRLRDAYQDRAREAKAALDEYWSTKAALLRSGRGLPAPAAFARLVRAGAADSVIVRRGAGGRMYPSGALPPDEPAELGPAWQDAVHVEHEQADPNAAAGLYRQIAAGAKDANVRARALRAQVRCLLGAGRGREAMTILTGPLAEPALGGATDRRGRLIAPNAALLAAELSADANDPKLAEHAARLAATLNDYAGPAMPAPQRRFLMHALREIGPGAARFDTLAAEELAAEYLDARPGLAEPHGLSKTAGGLWHMGDPNAGITAVFRGESLTAQMRSAADLAEPFAGATFSLAPPGSARGGREAFLSMPASHYLPDWQVEVRLLDADPFAAAAARQNAAYLWTGVLGIAVIAVLAAGVACYLGRQMRLTRLKNDFVATVSHELKTPLASMRVLVDTLLEGRCTDQRQAGEYFHLIARENERLSRLIDNFLTFSRMERKKRAFEFAPLNVAELVTEAVASVAGRFDGPGVRLDVDIAEDLPMITGDRDALITVILNLLDNAHKYSGPDKRIALRASAAGGEVRLAVSDNGIGLSRRAARKVFDRFYQVDQSLSRAAGGCGLGLSIVKFIVEAHGGAIDVAARPGEGSTFTIKLPVAGGKATATPQQAQAE